MAEHKMVTVDRAMLEPNRAQPVKEKKEAPKLESVVKQGKVVSTKPSLGKRIRSLFIADDVEDVGDYLVNELIIPFVKDTILDLGEMLLFGQTSGGRSGRRRRGGYSNMPTDYSASYKSPRDRERHDGGRRERYSRRGSDVDYREIILSDRNDARNVVASLRSRIQTYGSASVADLLELVDQTSVYTDTAYGWKDPEQITISRVGRGWLIDVDDAEALDD